MAAILEDGGQICGGALIAPSFVVSAAHCFHDQKAGGVDPAKAYSVQVGGADLGSTAAIAAAQVVLHPGYNPLTHFNDVAVLRLTSASSAPVQPLAAEGQTTAAGVSATVIGYGATEPDGSAPSTRLLTAQLPIISDGECAAEHEGIDGPRHICAGSTGTEAAPANDSCQGDSGGPLLVTGSGSGTQQVGIVSYGGDKCGVGPRGVYAEVAGYRDWIDAIVGGAPASQPDAANPDPAEQGAEATAIRVAASPNFTAAIEQAAEVSSRLFEMGTADVAVLARADLYPDALGGSTLGFGSGPLLFTDSGSSLPTATRDELVRALPSQGLVYILGGPAAVSPSIDDAVRALGLIPQRLAGADRFATARAVADEVVRTIGEGTVPSGTMIVATAFNWPDAVTGGQLGSWWGMPILLTQPDELNAATRAAIEQHRPARVLVLGGTTVVSDSVVAQIGALGPSVTRLAGATRWGTSAAILSHHAGLLIQTHGEVGPAIAVNLRRSDGFAHVLSASVLAGALGGLFVPLEGEDGSTLTPEMATPICGADLALVINGGRDLISDAGATRVQQAMAGQGC